MAEEKKALVTKDMLVGEIISKYPDAAFALMQCGMGCISCPASQAESLQDARYDPRPAWLRKQASS